MPKYRIINYYVTSQTHEVEAKDEEAAIEAGRDIDDNNDELLDGLSYDETVSLGEIKDEVPNAA